MFALAKCVGFAPLFQKRAGLGAEPHNTPFLFDNFFFAAPSDKEKVAMEFEKPRGYSRFKCANSLPAFLFDTRGTKRKANKREMPFYVGAAHTRDLLKKVDQNFHTFGECEPPDKSKFAPLGPVSLVEAKKRMSETSAFYCIL